MLKTYRLQSALLFVMALFVASLMGCAQLGVPVAKTFNERVAVAYSTTAAVADAAATLRNADKISESDKDNVLAQTRNAKAAIDVARNLHKTDADAASTRLSVTLQALTAMQAYLTSRGQ